ncbi:MAG TPA: alanine racemase [Chthoniobacterales bacterium]|nr:alanine racemase [Chthoniobacterales bacterium]
MHINDLETPVPVVDFDIARRNIRRLQDYCDAHRFNLRPHIKTHKLPLLAHEQLRAGAIGITVQKLGEAEGMAQTGIRDILLTYNVLGQEKAARLASLTNFAQITVAIDNEKSLDSVAWAAKRAQHSIGVLVEFESGSKRQGVETPERALQLARLAIRHSNIEFKGLMTFPTTPDTARFLEQALPLFRNAGIAVPVISGGGTQSAYITHKLAPVTEMRAGTYIYNDRMMITANAAAEEECALEVLATVVSRPSANRAVIDAGSKTLSSDRLPSGQADGYGLLPDYRDATIALLSEEHGILDLSRSVRKPEIGERLRIIPNHVCVVTNLHDHVYLHRSGEVIARLPVYLRGKTV